MSLRGALASIVLLTVALLLCATPRAGAEDEKRTFERVEYRPAKDDATIVSLDLVSPTQAELVPAKDAKTVLATWSLERGPTLRLVTADGSVYHFTLKADGATSFLPRRELLTAVSGAAWHAATVADPRRVGDLDMFSTGDEKDDAFVLYEGGQADWIRYRAGAIVAARSEKRPDGALVLKRSDNATRVFLPSDGAWREEATQRTYWPAVEMRNRRVCLNNLAQLAQIFVMSMMENKAKAMKYGGVATPLSWRKSQGIIRRGQELVLRCPCDPQLRALDEACRKAYDDVDLANPPTDLCSYAFRDFKEYPLQVDDKDKQVIACCRQGRDGRTPHHKGGICVAFDTGEAAFFTNEELSVPPGETIIVGEDTNTRGLGLHKVVQVAKH